MPSKAGRAAKDYPANARTAHELKVHQAQLEMLREAQEHLAASHDRYEELFEFAPVGYLTLDHRGVVHEINHTACTMCGVPRSKLAGRPFQTRIAREEAGKFLRHLQPRPAGSPRVETELRLVRADGRKIIVMMQSVPLAGAANGKWACRASLTEITRHKQAEHTLHETEERVRRLVETTRIIAWERPVRSTSFTYISGWAVKALGYPLADWARPGFFRQHIVHPEDRRAMAAATDEGIRTRDDFELEYRLVTADGRTLWVRDIVHVTRDARGPQVLKGFLIDITAQKQDEAGLRAVTERFELAVAGTADGLWDWDLTTDTVFYAPRFKELLGFATEDPRFPHTFESFRSRLHPDDLHPTTEAIRRAVEDGEPYRAVYRLQTATGDWRWFEARGTTVRGAGGRATRMAGSITDITTRKQADAALRESAMQLRLAIEGADLGLWDWNVPTGHFSVNERWCAMLGHTSGEIEPHITSWRERLHPDDLPSAQAAWAAHRDGQTPGYEAEYRMRHKDGGWVWVLDKGRVVERDAGGQPLRVCGTHLDITQRKHAEEALRASEEMFRQVTETIDQVFWMTSVDKMRMLYISPGYERIWGRTCQSLYDAPLTWIDAVHPEDRQRLIEAATTQQASGAYDVEYRIRRPDGSERWIQDRAFPVRDAAGAVRRVTGVAKDITSRKRAEQALRQSEATLARAQTLAHVGSYEIDRQPGGSSAWSPEIFHILGLDPAGGELAPADYIGRCIHPDDRERVAESAARAFRTGERYEEDYRIVRPGGEIRHVHSVAEPMEPAGTQKFIGFLQDVTDRRRLEAELLDISDHEQQRIGQDLHDDLCQQLVGLEFRLEALQGELPEASAAHGELTRIGGFLRLATRHARTMARVLSPVAMDPHGLMDALQSLAAHSTLLFRIECEYRSEKPVLLADHTMAGHLYRIAQEAITNAVKHGQARHIRLALSATADTGCLAIEDDGGGCPLPIPSGAGMGTRIMQYRAGIIGATLHLEPARSGGLLVTCGFHLPAP